MKLSAIPEDETDLLSVLEEMAISYTKVGSEYVIRLEETLDAYPILERVRKYLTGFSVLNGTMDDVFIRVTGKEMRE